MVAASDGSGGANPLTYLRDLRSLYAVSLAGEETVSGELSAALATYYDDFSDPVYYGMFIPSAVLFLLWVLAASIAQGTRWAADEPTVLYFGKLLYNKGVHVLFDALRELGDVRALMPNPGPAAATAADPASPIPPSRSMGYRRRCGRFEQRKPGRMSLLDRWRSRRIPAAVRSKRRRKVR